MSKADFNPFEMLGLNPSFELDTTALDAAYFARQALAHPDRFAHHSEPERTAAAVQASSLNQAYEALKNPVLRAKALLTLRSIEVPGEEGKPIQDPQILEEMMGLQEALAEADSPQDFSHVETQIQDCLQGVKTTFTSAVRKNQDKELPGLFLRLSYLSKLMGDIKARRRQSSIKVL